MQSINEWIHTNLSPTTYFCNVKFQANLSSRFSVNAILRVDSKSIAKNRLFNRLKYKTPGAHIYMVRSFIIKISNL